MMISPTRTINRIGTGRHAVATSSLVGVLLLAGLASCSSDSEAPADEPVATTDAPVAQSTPATPTTVAPVADSVADSVPSTGLVRIDGPATVDSGFSGANPSEGGG